MSFIVHVHVHAQSLPATEPTTRPIDLSSPTLVSLDLHDTPLADAARALSDQSGTRQLMAPVDDATKNAARPVTLHVEREPYLVAMTKLCGIAGVEPTRITESRLWLRKTDPLTAPNESRLSGPAYVTGPFLVIAQGVTSTRSSQATNALPDPIPDLNVQFTLLAEPMVSIVAIAQRVRLSEATDETGTILGDPQQQQPMPTESWARSFHPLEANDTFTATLAPGRPVGRRVATLKGVIDVRVVTAREVVRIDDVSVPHDGLRVRGHRASSRALITRGPNVAEIDLVIERDGADDGAWNELANLARISRFVIAGCAGPSDPPVAGRLASARERPAGAARALQSDAKTARWRPGRTAREAGVAVSRRRARNAGAAGV
jgi:hypothetical protein